MYICLSYVKEHNGKNLLDIYDAGDYGRYARKVMKILFSPAEMSDSILYANSTFAKPGLDPDRMRKFKGRHLSLLFLKYE